MTNLPAAIASGQVSAAQIEAHHEAGELPITMHEPRFQHTYCSQCGRDCGPGDDGVASCADHAAPTSQPVTPASPELKAAAQAVLDRWNSPKWEWHKNGPTADLMADLYAAIKATS